MRIQDGECKWTINRPRPASTNGISPVTLVVLVYAACIRGVSRQESNVRCDSRCVDPTSLRVLLFFSLHPFVSPRRRSY